MLESESKFVVKVDITNPGQFFACCGLFELAHRLWLGVEGYFDTQAHTFIFPCRCRQDGIELLKKLRECPLEGLSDAERQELKSLEARKQTLKKQKEQLAPQEEKRRKALGDKARSGRLILGEPFSLLLDWWQNEDEAIPKTWAGKQEIHKVARAAQEALSAIINPEDILDYACVLRQPPEYAKKPSESKKVAPFCFDARSFIHSLDTGFSADVQEMELMAYPAVELLALIGLQRFRPAAQGKDFDYWIWTYPMPAPVAAAIVCGAATAEASIQYRFHFRFRDDQRRYKAFGYATLFKGE